MRIINFLLIGLLVLGTATLSSCNKETKIEKNLWKKGGEWNIGSLTAHQVSTVPGDSYTETVFNYGSYTFKEDGSGIFVFTVDGDYESGIFHYTNTENELTINFGTNAPTFDMVWEKDKIQLTHTVNYIDNGESISYTETYNLEKKK